MELRDTPAYPFVYEPEELVMSGLTIKQALILQLASNPNVISPLADQESINADAILIIKKAEAILNEMEK